MADITGGLGGQLLADLHSQRPDIRTGGAGLRGFASGFLGGLGAGQNNLSNLSNGNGQKAQAQAEEQEKPGFLERVAIGVSDAPQIEQQGFTQFNLRNTLLRQEQQMNQLKIKEAVRVRNDAIENEQTLMGLADVIENVAAEGRSNEISGINDVLGFVGRNPALMADQRTKTLLDLFKASRNTMAARDEIKRQMQAREAARQQAADSGLEPTQTVVEGPGGVRQTFESPESQDEQRIGQLSDVDEALLNARIDAAFRDPDLMTDPDKLKDELERISREFKRRGRLRGTGGPVIDPIDPLNRFNR